MTQHILYLECRSGISGDMTVAALLDLGANREKLDKVLKSLNLRGYTYSVSETSTYGLRACNFDVKLDADGSEEDHHHSHHKHNHPHDPHGHDPQGHEHKHPHDHGHHSHHHDGCHPHDHDHKPPPPHEHPHEHRNLNDVYAVIDRAEMTEKARDLSKKIFKIVAEAEAKAHGLPIEEVHFHEVGAVDSIVDIVAAAVCIDDLGITETVVSELSEGSGSVSCQHGRLPVPVPAVAAIIAAEGLAMTITNVQGEMVTPTGAAIAAALKTKEKLPQSFTIKKIGLGAGKRDFGHANILRAMLIEENAAEEKASSDRVWLLESNIDDCTGEQLAFAMEKLFEHGALDVHYMACHMKKNRPGWLLRVLTDDIKLETLEDVIFSTTTTIGIRRALYDRTCLKRETVTIETGQGSVDIKKCFYKNKVFYYPEYESVKKLAERTGENFSSLFSKAKYLAEKEKI